MCRYQCRPVASSVLPGGFSIPAHHLVEAPEDGVEPQHKKIGGMEFYDVHFSYIDTETSEEKFISVPEQGGGSGVCEEVGAEGKW